MHVYCQKSVSLCIQLFRNIRVCACVLIYIHTCIYVIMSIHGFIQSEVCVYIFTYIRINIYAYVHFWVSTPAPHLSILHTYIQHVRTNMRLEIVIGIEINILDGQSSGLFSNEPFEKRPVMTFEDFEFHFDDHVESHSF